MRDDQIIHLAKSNDGKIMVLDQKIAAIYRQNQFMDTRIRAYEKIFSSRWTLLKLLIDPKFLKTQVDIEQMILLRKHDDEVKAAAEKLKEEQSKPKLTVVNSI